MTCSLGVGAIAFDLGVVEKVNLQVDPLQYLFICE